MAQEPAKRLYDGGSGSILYTDRRDFYIEPDVYKELWTDVAPFLTFIQNIESRTDMKDPMYKMFEGRAYWVDQRFQIDDTDAVGNNDTGVVVDLPTQTASNTYGLPTARSDAYTGLLCTVHSDNGGKPSGERKGIVIITTFTSGSPDTITIKNMSTTTFTHVSGDWYVVLGQMTGENQVAPTPWADELKVVWNQCGIQRTSLQVSGTMKTSILRGARDEYIRIRARKMAEHKIQKNRMMLFGSSRLGTNLDYAGTFADGNTTDADGNEIRATTGAFEALLKYGATTGDDQNIFSITEGSFSYNDWVDISEKMFQYYPEDGIKDCFCGAAFLSYFNKLAGPTGFGDNSKMSIQLSPYKRDPIGFNYKVLETPHGIVRLIHDPCITKSPYNKYGMIIDKSQIFHTQFRMSEYKMDIKKENGYDGQKDEIFSDEGMGMTLLPSHKLLKIV